MGKWTERGKHRGVCPVCGRYMGLTRGGKLPPHRDERQRGKSGYYDDCAGIGQKPV